MLLVADALQAFVVAGLMSVRGRVADMTLADLLTRPQKAGYDLDYNDADRTILIDFRESELVARAIAADCCRLGSAAFQTISTVADEMKNTATLPWSLVKLYYAAFYAGHAVLRICGESCSYFNRSHTDRIATILSAMGKVPKFSVDSGLYHCIVSPSATGLKCQQAKGAVGGGHESFWKVFGAWTKATSEAVLTGALTSAEAQEVFVKLEKLTTLIGGNGSRAHGWLSLIRNDLQYRHEFGVWSPSKLRKNERKFLGRLAEQWRREPMTVDLELGGVSPLGQFVIACAFVVALCRVMMVRIGERSTADGRSFVHFGPLGLLT